MSTAEAGLAGSWMFEYGEMTNESWVALMPPTTLMSGMAGVVSEMLPVAEKVRMPERSVASGLRLKPPLRFWLGWPDHATELRLKTVAMGMAYEWPSTVPKACAVPS